MKYSYYPGCVAEDTCKELNASMNLVAKELGLTIETLEEATCCGSGYIQEYNRLLGLFFNGRTLALSEKMGAETIITVCSLCQRALSEANLEFQSNPKSLEKVNAYLSKIKLKYSGNVKVKHLLQVLVQDYGLDRLSAKVKKPLGLKVAPFYSCQIIRPPELQDFDDPENPRSLDNLIKALGGTAVDYHGKTKCCGFHVLMVEEEVSLKMSGEHLRDAKSKGAECVVTPCPCCHLVFDMYQSKIEKQLGERLKLPILHVPQLVGMALGISPKALGLTRHMVSTVSIFAREAGAAEGPVAEEVADASSGEK